MAVELGLGVVVGQAVEVGEEVQLRVGRARAARLRARLAAPAQVVDQRLGVDLLLDVEGRRVDYEIEADFEKKVSEVFNNIVDEVAAATAAPRS